jgi:hypothetical protein
MLKMPENGETTSSMFGDEKLMVSSFIHLARSLEGRTFICLYDQK